MKISTWLQVFEYISMGILAVVALFVVVVLYCVFIYDDTNRGRRPWRIRERDLKSPRVRVFRLK